jgi:hypothetical protein
VLCERITMHLNALFVFVDDRTWPPPTTPRIGACAIW